MNLGVAVDGVGGTETDRLRSLAGEPKLSPGLAAHRDEGRDLRPLGQADRRENRRGRLAGFGRLGCLLHVRSPRTGDDSSFGSGNFPRNRL